MKYILRFEILAVLVTILLAIFVRTVFLDRSPASINWDEASLGYSSYSIMKTGRDEYGKVFPLSLRSFSDFKPALYSYLSIPFIYVFGLTQTSTRLVSALAGSISLFGVWLLLRLFVKESWLRLVLLILISFEPWRIHFSRVALETNLSASIFIFGAYFLLKYFLSERKSYSYFLWAFAIFVVSAYAYHSARLASPILLVLVLADPINWFNNKWSWSNLRDLRYVLMGVLFMLFLVPVFVDSSGGQVLARFSSENFFSRYYPFVTRDLFDGSFKSWVLDSPIYSMLGMMFGRLVTYLSPVNYSTNYFHWIRNSVQYVPDFNLFGLVSIPFLVVGITCVFRSLQNASSRFLVYWIVAAASPTIITWNWFHALRFLNGLPAIELLVALGVLEVIRMLPSSFNIKSLFVVLLFGLVIWQAVFVINNEYNFSVVENHGEFQPGGFKEGVPVLMSMIDRYDKVIIDSPHAQSYIFLLFYSSYDPKVVQSYSSDRLSRGLSGTGNFNFDKFEFRKMNWSVDNKLRRTILWTSSTVSDDEIKAAGGHVYRLPSPLIKYQSSMLISFD